MQTKNKKKNWRRRRNKSRAALFKNEGRSGPAFQSAEASVGAALRRTDAVHYVHKRFHRIPYRRRQQDKICHHLQNGPNAAVNAADALNLCAQVNGGSASSAFGLCELLEVGFSKVRFNLFERHGLVCLLLRGHNKCFVPTLEAVFGLAAPTFFKGVRQNPFILKVCVR